MQPHCQTLHTAVAEEMYQVVARALCDRPGENGAQRDSRTRQLVHFSIGLGPRDGLELALSSLVFGHVGMILDSMKDVHMGMGETQKGRTKAGIVAMDRAMVMLLREYREARARPSDQAGPGLVVVMPEAMRDAMEIVTPGPAAAAANPEPAAAANPDPTAEAANSGPTVDANPDPTADAANPSPKAEAANPDPAAKPAQSARPKPAAGAGFGAVVIDPAHPPSVQDLMDDPAFIVEVDKLRLQLMRELGLTEDTGSAAPDAPPADTGAPVR
jgi:hypothetical protein